MKYNRELNKLLLNIQRKQEQALRKKQTDKATVDKRIIRERQKLREKNNSNKMVINPAQKIR